MCPSTRARFALAALLVAACAPLTACRPAAASRPDAGAPAGPHRGPFERELLLTGELEAVTSVSIKSPQTQLFQLRIQHMAQEGKPVKAGDVILTFDSASLVAQVDDLEARILDAKTQIVVKQAEIASAAKDLEIALAENRHAADDATLLASVDPDVLARKVWGERQLAKQKADAELAETLRRAKLTDERSRADLDVLVIARDKLEQDLAQVRQSLDLLSIKAPCDGVVIYERKMESMTRYQEGDSAWPGQGILQIPDLSKMRAELLVDETDVPMLSEGMPVSVVLDAFPEREVGGHVERMPPMAVRKSDDSKINVFRVLAALDETWAGDMKPGMSVRARAIIDHRDDAPLLPRESVRFDGERWWWPATAPREKAIELHPLARNARDYVLSEEEFARVSSGGDA